MDGLAAGAAAATAAPSQIAQAKHKPLLNTVAALQQAPFKPRRCAARAGSDLQPLLTHISAGAQIIGRAFEHHVAMAHDVNTVRDVHGDR